MRKIIAAVDGSVYSTSVCEHAIWLAKRYQASVELVHVIGRQASANDNQNLSGSIGLGARSALLDELSELDERRAKLNIQRGRAILDDGKSLIEAAGVSVTDTRLRHDELADSIQQLETDADLVVIGKRGDSADFDTLHLGSNLERVARASNKPVLVAARAFKPIQKILIAFDGGRSVGLAIDMLATDSTFADLTVELLAVGLTPTAMRDRLEAARQRLADAGFDVSCHEANGDTESIIAGRVNGQGFDMLMMGAYGHSRIRNLFIGSTTTEMLRSCLVPVMLFR